MSVPLSLGPVVQIAYRVADVEAAARTWATRTGAGPFFLRHHEPMAAVGPDGAPGEFVHSSAYGQWGEVQLELVALHRVSPPSAAGLIDRPAGVHHMAVFVPSREQAVQSCVAAGWTEAMTATTPTGMAFTFLSGHDELGHLLELYEPVPALVGFYDLVRDAARHWGGSDPVRPI